MKYFQIIILLFLTGYLLPISAQTDEKYCLIYGTVTDSVTGEPLAGATILISYYDNLKIKKDVNGTDINGNYWLKKLQPGRYDLKFMYIGYSAELRKGIIVNSGSTIKLDVNLKEPYIGQALEEIRKDSARIWRGGLIVIAGKSVIPDSILNALYKKYGFQYELIGCDPTGEEEHNAIIEEYLAKRNGVGWRKRMEAEIKKLEDYYRNKK